MDFFLLSFPLPCTPFPVPKPLFLFANLPFHEMPRASTQNERPGDVPPTDFVLFKGSELCPHAPSSTWALTCDCDTLHRNTHSHHRAPLLPGCPAAPLSTQFGKCPPLTCGQLLWSTAFLDNWQMDTDHLHAFICRR